MRPRIHALLAMVAVLTACLEPLPVPTGRFGAIVAPTFARTSGGFALRPSAAFYGSTDLSYVPFPSDTCLISPYSDSAAVGGNQRLLDAGEFIQASVSGRVDSLFPLPGLSLRIYEYPAIAGIPFTPGDTLSIVVPGSVFPTSAVSVRTAEPFTHGAIGIPAAEAGLPLSWDAAVASGTQMTFSLRYHNGIGSPVLNEQVYCSFIDDGAATIAAGYLQGWRDAQAELRSTKATRIRSRVVTVDARTSVLLLSSFSQPTPSAGAATIR